MAFTDSYHVSGGGAHVGRRILAYLLCSMTPNVSRTSVTISAFIAGDRDMVVVCGVCYSIRESNTPTISFWTYTRHDVQRSPTSYVAAELTLRVTRDALCRPARVCIFMAISSCLRNRESMSCAMSVSQTSLDMPPPRDLLCGYPTIHTYNCRRVQSAKQRNCVSSIGYAVGH